MLLMIWRNRQIARLLFGLFEDTKAALEDGEITSTERSALFSRFLSIAESVRK